MYLTKTQMFLPVILTLLSDFIFRASAVRIVSSAPVNPVDQNGVFALHCHIWDLAEDHQVSIYRSLSNFNDKYELLAVDNYVQPNVAEGIFLAVRQMGDSSRVYFLTVGGVSKPDEGRYTCMVTGPPPRFEIVAEEATDMKVLYFPTDGSLSCSSMMQDQMSSPTMTLYEGVPARFNCSSSESGNPVVSIGWKQTGTDRRLLAADQITTGNTVYSVLTYTPRLEDDKVVLICEMKSAAFPTPTGSRTCHIGPLTVRPKHKAYTGGPVYVPTSKPLQPPANTNNNVPSITHTTNITEDCSQVCADTITYWIIATIFLSIVAFIFFAIAVVLSVKYCHLPVEEQPDYIAPYVTRRVPTLPGDISDKLYVEVEHKRNNGQMYMSLQRPLPKDIPHQPKMVGTLNNN